MDYHRLEDQTDLPGIGKNVQEFLKLSKQLDKLRGERKELRNSQAVNKAQDEAMSLSKIIMEDLKNYKPDRSEKRKFDNIRNEFNKSFYNFQKISNEVIIQEEAEVQEIKESLSEMGFFKVEVSASLIDEEELNYRNERVQSIVQDMQTLQNMFREVNELVGEQGDQLNKVEENVERADKYIKQANNELAVAAEYQKKSRSKVCFLVLIVGIVLLLGVVFVDCLSLHLVCL